MQLPVAVCAKLFFDAQNVVVTINESNQFPHVGEVFGSIIRAHTPSRVPVWPDERGVPTLTPPQSRNSEKQAIVQFRVGCPICLSSKG
jgi:hypothetical protein